MPTILPRQEYRDLWFTWYFGPLSASSFAQYNVSSDSIASTSISSISDSTSLSDEATTGPLSSENFATVSGVGFCPDKDIFVDAAWVRAENISTVDLNKLRWLWVGAAQRVSTAWQNRQWITLPLNIGDDSSSESTFGGEDSGLTGLSYQPLVVHTKRDFSIRAGHNKIPAGGLLLLLADTAPTNLAGLYGGLRLRERKF